MPKDYYSQTLITSQADQVGGNFELSDNEHYIQLIDCHHLFI